MLQMWLILSGQPLDMQHLLTFLVFRGTTCPIKRPPFADLESGAGCDHCSGPSFYFTGGAWLAGIPV